MTTKKYACGKKACMTLQERVIEAANRQFKKIMTVSLTLCGLGLGLAGALLYAPRVPDTWKKEIREHASVMVDLYYPNERERYLRESIARARGFPLIGRTGQGTVLPDRFGPPAFAHGAIMLRKPSIYPHEWLHFFDKATTNHLAAAEAFTNYRRDYDNPAHVAYAGASVTRVNITDNKAVITLNPPYDRKKVVTFDFETIDRAFRSHNECTSKDMEEHNKAEYTRFGTRRPGGMLGNLAWLLEESGKKPAYSLTLLKLVTTGTGTRQALRELDSGKHNKAMRLLEERNPVLAPQKRGGAHATYHEL